MWTVKLTTNAKRQLTALIQQKAITKEDIKILLRWVDEMEEFGPDFVRTSGQWHDHSLENQWLGYRSSAFCKSGRVIYRIIESQVIVEVHRVTATHDYKK